MKRKHMVLVIYTFHQIHLVMQMNYFAKKRFPPLVLIKIDDLIIEKRVDSDNPVFLIKEVVRKKATEIPFMFNMKPEEINHTYESIIIRKKKRVWFLLEIRLITGKTIFVIYSRRKKDVL